MPGLGRPEIHVLPAPSRLYQKFHLPPSAGLIVHPAASVAAVFSSRAVPPACRGGSTARVLKLRIERAHWATRSGGAVFAHKPFVFNKGYAQTERTAFLEASASRAETFPASRSRVRATPPARRAGPTWPSSERRIPGRGLQLVEQRLQGFTAGALRSGDAGLHALSHPALSHLQERRHHGREPAAEEFPAQLCALRRRWPGRPIIGCGAAGVRPRTPRAAGHFESPPALPAALCAGVRFLRPAVPARPYRPPRFDLHFLPAGRSLRRPVEPAGARVGPARLLQ